MHAHKLKQFKRTQSSIVVKALTDTRKFGTKIEKKKYREKKGLKLKDFTWIIRFITQLFSLFPQNC